VQVAITGLGGTANNLSWSGTNNNGQYVDNGVYYVVLSSTNAFGQVTSVTDTVSVVGAGSTTGLVIYNSAGEAVDTLDITGLNSQVVGMSLELPSGHNGIVVSPNPKALSPTGGVTVLLDLADGSQVPEYWNGLSSSGQPVQPGTYMMQLSQVQPGSSVLVKGLTVTVLGTTNQSAQGMAESALVVPNPVKSSSGGGVSVAYTSDGVDAAAGVLYDLAGERVAVASNPAASSGPLNFSARLSDGIYLVDFEVRDNSVVLARRVLRVAVVK